MGAFRIGPARIVEIPSRKKDKTVNKTISNLVDEVEDIVETGGTEEIVTEKVAKVLERSLKEGLEIPASHARPNSEHYVMYPLYVDDQNRFSIASAVWDVGQGTPVHGHETWGVVGIYSGQEHEIQYEKPKKETTSLSRLGEDTWSPGQVTVCCTTDDDVHQVSCAGSQPCVGIHIYGDDIGTLERRTYDPNTGEVSWFVSKWSEPTE